MFEEYTKIREEKIPIKNLNDYKTIRLIGSTGAGKSEFMRYLLGTGEYGFPATATGKCTVAKIEAITYVDNDKYSAVVTFYNEKFIHSKIEELLDLIVEFTLKDLQCSTEKMYQLFRNISNETFKLNFLLKYEDVESILKNLYNLIKNNVKIEDIKNKDNGNDFIEEYSYGIINNKSNNFISDIMTITVKKIKSILEEFDTFMTELGYKGDYSYIGENDRNLASGIVINGIKNKEDFFKILNIFYNNYITYQGKILNTVVEGIRIIGNFTPNWYGGGVENYKYIFIDGIGLGHNRDYDIHTENEIKDYDYIIYLKNNSVNTDNDSMSFIEMCIRNNFICKVFNVFTHFDETLENPELIDFVDRKNFMISNLISQLEEDLKNKKEEVNKGNDKEVEKALIKSLEIRYGAFMDRVNNNSFVFSLCNDNNILTRISNRYKESKNKEELGKKVNDELDFRINESKLLLDSINKEYNLMPLNNIVHLQFSEKMLKKVIEYGIFKFNTGFWEDYKRRDGRTTTYEVKCLCHKYADNQYFYSSLNLTDILRKDIILYINSVIDKSVEEFIKENDNANTNETIKYYISSENSILNQWIYKCIDNKAKECMKEWQDAYCLKNYHKGKGYNSQVAYRENQIDIIYMHKIEYVKEIIDGIKSIFKVVIQKYPNLIIEWYD